MKIQSGYKTFDTGKWTITIDEGAKMLECPKCHCRAIMEEYMIALGTEGMRFCPYCGTDLRSDPEQLTFEAFMNGGT